MNSKHVGFVYVISNQHNTVLYTGFTSGLRSRINEHKTKFYPKSFSAKYNCNKLVWYEKHDYIEESIAREKQIKAGNRKAKESLINSINLIWKGRLSICRTAKLIVGGGAPPRLAFSPTGDKLKCAPSKDLWEEIQDL